MNLETIEHYTLPPEAHVLPFQSFLANFYDVDQKPGFLAKVYCKDQIWGMIPLDEPDKRAQIILNEIESLQALAPQLDAHYALVQLPNGYTEEAIVMRKLQQEEFLEKKIINGDVISIDNYKDLAKLVADYHFSLEGISSSDNSLPSFLSDLMNHEIQILINKFPTEKETYEQWHMLIQKYIADNQALLQRRQELLGEPIIGHGDIKVSNIIITEQIGLTDPAPIELWRINDRRMDAYFLAADLELSGFKTEAKFFWDEYCTEYDTHLQNIPLTDNQREEIAQSTKVIDMISHIYRFGIFYRLAKATENEERAELAKGYIVRAYQTM